MNGQQNDANNINTNPNIHTTINTTTSINNYTNYGSCINPNNIGLPKLRAMDSITNNYYL